MFYSWHGKANKQYSVRRQTTMVHFLAAIQPSQTWRVIVRAVIRPDGAVVQLRGQSTAAGGCTRLHDCLQFVRQSIGKEQLSNRVGRCIVEKHRVVARVASNSEALGSNGNFPPAQVVPPFRLVVCLAPEACVQLMSCAFALAAHAT